jgi:hypothetical protein
MARPPKPENSRNPLRQLRALLSNDGPDKPITQNRLSEICDIPTFTIRSIEAGRRTLNSSALKKIEEVTTATWNSKRGQWTVYESNEPLTFSWYSLHRQLMAKRPGNYQSRVRLVHAKIDGLFDQISERSWNLLESRINDFLEGCRRAFKLKDFDGLYQEEARFEKFLDYLKSQNLPKPMYSPSAISAFDAKAVSPHGARKRAKRRSNSLVLTKCP